VELHDLSGGQPVLDRMHAVAKAALTQYDFSPAATATPISVSENLTFRIDDPATGRRAVMRVHRLGYHTYAGVLSELQWMTSLREAGAIHAPAVIPTRDGRWIVETPEPDGHEPRLSVLFEFVPGVEPNPTDIVAAFEPLGEMTARMHRHTRAWPRPAGFERHHWNYETAFGRNPTWGRWQDTPGVGPAEHAVFQRLDDTMRRRLGAFGMSPERYGLIHTDLRFANLIVDGERTTVIDFDDSGFSWYLYDFGGAVAFIEDHPEMPRMIESWVRGYRRVLELSDEEADEIPTFIMYRRMTLVAWIGSHPNTDTAAQFGPGLVSGSVPLAERYLKSHG
jgi:Ser/Thr protein kinase RdoA (MazF antagonist)